MGKLKQKEILEKEYAELETKAKMLAQPLIIERKRRWDLISDWFEKEYSKIEGKINAIHDRQADIEEKIEYLEDTMIHCKWCDKAVDELDKDAVDNGFDYCTECFHALDQCETCGAIGQYGTNTESNNIIMCWECGVTYCDSCDHECPEEEDD